MSKEIDEGAKKLTEAQLNMQIIGKKESNKIPEDHIISQDINEGSVVRKNTIVNVKVSSPDLLQVVPNMMGMDAKESSKTCDELGLKIKTDEQYSSVIEKGCVVSQSVEPYEEVEDESEISVTVSKGRAEDIKEEEITVPNFVGMKYDEVLTQAEEMNCTIKVTDREYNKDYDRDVTISQSPAADTKIKNTQAIEITASLGNEMVKVPNVELRSEAKAKVQLSGRGLESNVRYESNEMILEGLVISREPKKDTNVYPESTVELVVSTGAAPVDMPNVVGMQEDEANETLVNSGFSVTLDYKHSESEPEGQVISQSVSAGSKVKRGDEIIITVATNSSTIEVPNLIGQTKSAAEKEIKNKGLTSNLNYISENNRSDGVVVSQIPAPGINVKPKSVVTINIDLISEESDNSEIESRGENSETSTVNTSNSDTDKKDSDSNIDTSKDNEIESKTDTDTRSKKESDTDRRAESTVSSRKDSDTSSNFSSSSTSSQGSTSSQESSSSQTTTSVSSRPTSSVTSSQTSSNNNTTSSKGNSSKTTSSNTASNTEIKVTGIIISESNV
ncbi:MAG: PASTA domain-containing protein, partial [Clostridia bacterium]|nr:PASTA domain-containing protein [Clostridia bacterium]